MISIEEKFWSKVIKTNDTDCWNWSGWIKHGKWGGYGLLRIYESTVNNKKFKDWRAPRLSWLLHYGSLPEDLCICHKCDNPKCVNPTHLFLGTARENQQDKMSKGRYRNGNSNKIHCIKGHLLSGENLKVAKDGRRNCRECCNTYWREVYYPQLKAKKYYVKRSKNAAHL